MKYIKTTARAIFYLFYGSKIAFRSLLYSILFESYGNKTFVIGKIKVIKPRNISIGNNSTLNEGVFINAIDKISIGNRVHISPYVIINSGYLDLDDFSKKIHKSKPVIILDNVWICSGAIINPGVTIGKGAVIASGSVVTKNVNPHSLVTGIPAKHKKTVK